MKNDQVSVLGKASGQLHKPKKCPTQVTVGHWFLFATSHFVVVHNPRLQSKVVDYARGMHPKYSHYLLLGERERSLHSKSDPNTEHGPTLTHTGQRRATGRNTTIYRQCRFALVIKTS